MGGIFKEKIMAIMAKGKNIPYNEIIERRNCGSSRIQCNKCGAVKRIKNMGMYKGQILCSYCKPHIIMVGAKSKTQIEEEFLLESNKIEREYSSEALQSAKEAWKYAKDNRREFTVRYVLGIHKKLMRIINTRIAGRIRTCAVSIGGEIRDQSSSEIKRQLSELITLWNENKDILKNKRKQDKENFVKRWHILFEFIHFAEDGNGRTGRILMNIQRLLLNLPVLVIHAGFEQENYYLWFRRKRCYIWKYQEDEIIKSYNQGKGESISRLAYRFGLNNQAVSNLLKRNGIKVIIQWNNPPKNSRNGNWKGGKVVDKTGYVYVSSPNHPCKTTKGYVAEHRLVMEKIIGRNLLKKEVIHHIDGNVKNNSVENLKLFENNSIHRKIHAFKEKRDENGRFRGSK